MKKVITLILIITLVALVGTFIYFKGKSYQIIIPQAKIDETLAEKFPAKKTYLVIFSIIYSNPQVTLLEAENRVQVGLDVTLNTHLNDELEQLGGGVSVTAGIRYDSDTQEFFLDDVEFDRLEIQGVPEKWLETVTEVASKAAKEFLQTQPVYRLRANDAKTTAAKLLLKGVEIREKEIHVTLGL